jgi:hypothetical protein
MLKMIKTWLENDFRRNLPSDFEKAPYRATVMQVRPAIPTDPDAPIRTGMELPSVDQKSDHVFFKCLFQLIQAGSLDSARSYALKCDRPWVAATISGGQLHNFTCDAQSSEIITMGGNVNRRLWKRMCIELAKQVMLKNSTCSLQRD